MQKLIYVVVLLSGLIFSSCHHVQKSSGIQNTQTEIPYRIAERYFVKNTITTLHNPKIETAEQFNQVFGAATIMGKNGKPTPIDFTKEFVIAVIKPNTDYATEIKPVSLLRNEKSEIIFNYSVATGAKQTYTIVPSLIIIVDKENRGAIVINEQK